jgi:hypothetical protein
MSAPLPSARPPKRYASVSVFMIVLVGSYISIGALAHDLGFPVVWTALSTILIWAAPAQVILITSLGAGAAPLESGIAVGLSGMRLLPMVVALLPVLRTHRTRAGELMLPAHFTAVSMWIEALRLTPALPRENRLAFANGLSTGLVCAALGASIVGYYLAGVLPPALVAAMLSLTQMSFLTSALRNARQWSDQAAYVAGVVMAPLLAYEQMVSTCCGPA